MKGKIRNMQTAAKDLARGRAAKREASRPHRLVRLNRDGSESRMHDALERFATREAALAKVERVRQLNPGKTIRYALDGEEV